MGSSSTVLDKWIDLATQFQYHHQEVSENQLETHRAIQDIYFEEVLIHFLFDVVDRMRRAEEKKVIELEEE